MFKKSLLLVLMVVTLVFASSFASQMMLSKDLPSSFDPGLQIDEAFKTSQVPLLIEFYSDTCTTCKRVAPMIHTLAGETYKDKLTLVMLDMDDPANLDIARLFGVDTLPGIYVFNFKKMKKHQIDSETFLSEKTLAKAIDDVLVLQPENQKPNEAPEKT